MKITRSDHEKLVVTDFPYLLGAFFFLMGLGWFVYLVIAQSGMSTGDFIAHAIVIGLLFLGGAFITKRCLFEFDLQSRELKWSHTSLFGRKGGTIPFHQITGTKIEAASDEGTVTYLLILTTFQGDIPMSMNSDRRGEAGCKAVGDSINRALGITNAL